jgi:hypothetical protein
MSTTTFRLLLLLIFLAGLALRVVDFPRIPPGLNQDEASSAYEAFSLALTGADRWGNKLPPYFPGWGTGQNVLLSYLSIPFVKWLGLSIVTTRLVPLLLGILTLPLVALGLRPLGRLAVILGMLLVAIVPWHFMLSRWALESNLAPFFMLLGCVCVSRALITGRRRWIIPSLLPFALALYAYGTTAIVLPVMAILLLLVHWPAFAARPSAWLLALSLFALAAFPFSIFFLENYVLHRDLAWASHLPFDTPLLLSTRLAQVAESEGTKSLVGNLAFLASGFDDGTCYNKMPGYPLLLLPVMPLALTGIAAASVLLLRHRRQKAVSLTPARVTVGIYLVWALATLPLLALFPQNINRFNHFYLPAIILAAWAADRLIAHMDAAVPKRLVTALLFAGLLAEGSLAVRQYFTDYDSGRIKQEFNAGLDEAFAELQKLPAAQLRISNSFSLSYVYTLFFTHYPPHDFQRQVVYDRVDGRFDVARFGRYVFHDDQLAPGPYAYLGRKGETLPGNAARHIAWSNDDWEVGTAEPVVDADSVRQATQPSQ